MIHANNSWWLRIALICLLMYNLTATGQTAADTRQNHLFRVMSYNVENLFDTYDNPEKDDDDFLPQGPMHWTQSRYYDKLNKISEVISRTGQWDWPAIIGLVEVESPQTMEDLTHRPALRQRGYQYLITNSPDRRGINVALLYLPDRFKLLHHYEFRVRFDEDPDKLSRNILYAQGQLPNGAHLHVFVCHLPSRREGARITNEFRREAARVIREQCDSIAEVDRNAQLLIMGDFNGDPNEAATSHELEAGLRLPKHPPMDNLEFPPQLYNLFGEHAHARPPGSYVYRGNWTQLDQIIISESLLTALGGLQYLPGSAQTVFDRYLLHVHDDGLRTATPNRTYMGPNYKGGYSDHLPIIADFMIRYPKENNEATPSQKPL